MPDARWANCSPVLMDGGSAAEGSLLVVNARVRLELGQFVFAGDGANRAAARPHDDGLRDGTAGPVADAVHQLAVRDAGCDEEAVIAADQVLGVQNLVEHETGVERTLPLFVAGGPQASLDDA